MMNIKSEIILEGTYQYFKSNKNFARENFKIVKIKEKSEYQVYAEFISKLDSDEQLKIMTQYTVDENFSAIFVQIEKTISNKYVVETYSFEKNRTILKYKLKNSSGSQDFSMPWSEEFHLSSPAFSASTIWMKKISDLSGVVTLKTIVSENEWHYSKPPQEKIIYARLRNESMDNYKLNNIPLSASLWELSPSNEFQGQELVTSIYTGREFSVPYELNDENLKILLTNFVKHA